MACATHPGVHYSNSFGLICTAWGSLTPSQGAAMGLIAEFKEFALKGSVIDLAVGLIIGAVFGTLVTSLVKDVMTPPLGWLTGGVDFQDKVLVIQHKDSVHKISGKPLKEDVVIRYGNFINNLINFIIQAFA